MIFRENWGLYCIFLVDEIKRVGHGSCEGQKYLKEEKNEWLRLSDMENYCFQIMTQGQPISRSPWERVLK